MNRNISTTFAVSVILVVILFTGVGIGGWFFTERSMWQDSSAAEKEMKKAIEKEKANDIHGCVTSAGYAWCEATQKCQRTWEEDCASGYKKPDERDAHGCITSTGFSWCETKKSCALKDQCPKPAK